MMDQRKTGRPLDGFSRPDGEREKFRQLEGENARPDDERHAELRRQAMAAFEILTSLPGCIDRECFTSLQRDDEGQITMGDVKFGDHRHVRPELLEDEAKRIEAILHIHPLGSEIREEEPQDYLPLGDQINTRAVIRSGADPDLSHYLLDANDGRVYEFQQSSPGNFYHRTEIGSVADNIVENAKDYNIHLGEELEALQNTMRAYGQNADPHKGHGIETPRPEKLDIPKLEF